MSDESRYGIQRGLFNSFCVFIIIAALYQSCTPFRTRTTTTRLPVTYQRRFCDENPLNDYSNRNPDHITVTLSDQCFANHIKLPLAWDSFFAQKSQNPDDWASVWCTGHTLPSEPRMYYQDMANIFQGCRESTEQSDDFYLEGKGTITFRRTSTRPQYAAKAQENEVEATYKVTPINPSSGDPAGYSLTIKQCYRSGEKILCWGIATNKTDAPTTLDFRESHAVDDEGNSIVNGYGSGFMFPGSSISYNGGSEHLLPNVPTKFTVTINDP